jgi:hypothetical protein
MVARMVARQSGRALECCVVARAIRLWASQEVGVGRLLPWFAVAYGAGIVLYFTAKREPAIEVDTIKSYSVAAANYLFKLLGNESLKTKAISMSRRLYEEAGATLVY